MPVAGEPFICGQTLPYDPKYHEVWVRNRQEDIYIYIENIGGTTDLVSTSRTAQYARWIQRTRSGRAAQYWGDAAAQHASYIFSYGKFRMIISIYKSLSGHFVYIKDLVVSGVYPQPIKARLKIYVHLTFKIVIWLKLLKMRREKQIGLSTSLLSLSFYISWTLSPLYILFLDRKCNELQRQEYLISD